MIIRIESKDSQTARRTRNKQSAFQKNTSFTPLNIYFFRASLMNIFKILVDFISKYAFQKIVEYLPFLYFG